MKEFGIFFKSVEEGAAENIIESIIKKLKKKDSSSLGWITKSNSKKQIQNENNKGANPTNRAWRKVILSSPLIIP